LGARPVAEEPSGAEEDERRRHWKDEVAVGEEAQRVQDDDQERRETDRNQRRGAAGSAERNSDEAGHDPEDRPWEPARELVESEGERLVSGAVGDRTEELVSPLFDPLEARAVARICERKPERGR